MSCSELIVSSPIMVDAQIHRWTITNDDIYLLKFHEEPPQWLEDIIEGIIVDTGLITDVDNLEDRFSNFEVGYTEHFYDWKDGDTHTLAYVENIYTTNTVFNAGIQDIKVAYVSKNESGAFFDSLIGAWQTGAGGAWFNEKVSVVSNVAYSAARSASTLTATLVSQQDSLEAIAGELSVLQSQIDGKVETFTGYHPVVDVNGDLIPTADPYAMWVTEGTVSQHTGDTYVLLSVDANGNDAIEGMWGFSYDFDSQIYSWTVITNTLAAEAYAAALEAGVLADGKINTYYQATPPTKTQDPTLGEGDLWIDSDTLNEEGQAVAQNLMYRHDGTTTSDWVDGWRLVRDTAITASVDRLDEATVSIDGSARAKSSLTVNADGVVSGYVAEADNDSWSIFNIFADKFYVSGTAGTSEEDFQAAPFSIATGTSSYPASIKFNGLVEFSNTIGAETVVQQSTLTYDLARDTTIIDGSRIQTGSIDANLANIYNINANTITSGQIFNTGGNINSYTMMINLDGGEIHIK